MPKQYLEIKKSYLRRGKSLKTAKKLAAMTYNKLHPGHANPWAHESKFAKRVKKGMKRR